MTTLFYADSLKLSVGGKAVHSTPCRKAASLMVIALTLGFLAIRLQVHSAMQQVYNEDHEWWVAYLKSPPLDDIRITSSQ